MTHTWLQHYDPFNSPVLSTIVAACPVVVLLGSIAFLKIRIHFAALLGLGVALLVALWTYGMPADTAAATTLYGAAFGLFPIGWIILNVIFLYQLTVQRGLFDQLRASLARLAPDPRVQVILIAFSFGAFIEGVAGFGTPVAITAAILIQLGFRPLHASGLALIANTAPVAFGSLGIPITTLEQVTGLDALKVSAMVGRQLPFFSVLVPFWVVAAYAGWRGMVGVWPAALVGGVAFAVPQFLVSNLHGPWLVDIISGACSISALVVLLRYWQPAAEEIRNPKSEIRTKQSGEPGIETVGSAAQNPVDGPAVARTASGPREAQAGSAIEAPAVSELACPMPSAAGANFRTTALSWSPWAILIGCILLWGLPQFKARLDQLAAPKFEVPHLHNVVQRVPPVAPAGAKPERAEFRLNFLSATGTGILLAAVIAGLVMGFGPRQLIEVYLKTIWRIRFSLLTIAAMLAIGNVTKYSGTDATLGLALAQTGLLYPFFGTLLGWLGVALTGSDTASNVLFGSLQMISSERLGLSPILMTAANSSGGVMGKMIDAQSIVVASTATNWYGHEGSILRYVLFHSIALAAMMGILVTLQAYCWPFSLLVVSH